MDRGEQIQTTDNDRKFTEKGEWARLILGGALRVAAAYALGRAQLPFGALPFGFAALSATGGHVAFVAAGLALSLIGRENAAAYLVSYALVLLLRAIVCVVSDTAKKSEGLFGEHISMRAVVCAVGAFCVGLYRLSEGGFLYYDLFGAIISICVSAAGACLFYTLESERTGDFARTLGLTALLCAVAWGIRNVELYGISIGVLFSMLASLIVMRKKGLLHGTLIALSTGLCVSLSFAPLFVFGTVLYSFLGTVTPFFGAVASLGVGVAWGIYIQGIGALSVLLPALLAANFVFLTVDRLYLSSDKEALSHERTEQVTLTPTIVTNDISLARLNDTAHRIKLLCEGFSSLSDMLIKADISDTEQDLCFEIGEMADSTMRMSSYSAYLADALRSAAIAGELRAISEYLAGIMLENEKHYILDADLSSDITRALNEKFPNIGITASALGENRQRILAFCTEGAFLAKYSDDIRRECEKICSYPLTATEALEMQDRSMITLERKPLLSADFSGKKQSCEGEELCGDSLGIIQGGDRAFAFISDGMGSGREAAVTSGLCALFLQKLLPINNFAGDCVSATLEALNSFLCGRNGAGVRECASTIDLVSLDLVDCKAVFYKCGAAPTYIFRDGALFKIRAHTMPMGIVKQPDIGRINMELLPNDIIVMVSDGVTQGREECPELFELLRSRILTHNAEQLADAVMEHARAQGCNDDVSVLVIKISEIGLPIIGRDKEE